MGLFVGEHLPNVLLLGAVLGQQVVAHLQPGGATMEKLCRVIRS